MALTVFICWMEFAKVLYYALYYSVFLSTLCWAISAQPEWGAMIIDSFFVARSLTLTTWFCWHLQVRTPCVVCYEFAMINAAQFNVVFNASKSECLCCHLNGTTKHWSQDACLCLPSFLIGSQLIEFVDKWPHLGHIITKDCMDTRTTYSQNMQSHWTNE